MIEARSLSPSPQLVRHKSPARYDTTAAGAGNRDSQIPHSTTLRLAIAVRGTSVAGRPRIPIQKAQSESDLHGSLCTRTRRFLVASHLSPEPSHASGLTKGPRRDAGIRLAHPIAGTL